MAFKKNNNMIAGACPPVLTFAGAPVDGVAGTFAGACIKGQLLVDTTNGLAYINTNTKASPTWTKVGVQV